MKYLEIIKEIEKTNRIVNTRQYKAGGDIYIEVAEPNDKKFSILSKKFNGIKPDDRDGEICICRRCALSGFVGSRLLPR